MKTVFHEPVFIVHKADTRIDQYCCDSKKNPTREKSSNTLAMKSSGMKKILTITSVLILCLVLALAAGCSQPAAPPGNTCSDHRRDHLATTAATPVPTTLSLTPGPTQTSAGSVGC